MHNPGASLVSVIYNIDTFEQTLKLAKQIAQQVRSGSVVLLKGDLGSGKTTFSQFFIKALCVVVEEVTSPTFNLVHTYQAADFVIWHFDLYRLKNAEEVYELGIEDALSHGVALIEWPELIEDMLSVRSKITIHFSYTHSDNRRLAEVVNERVIPAQAGMT